MNDKPAVKPHGDRWRCHYKSLWYEGETAAQAYDNFLSFDIQPKSRALLAAIHAYLDRRIAKIKHLRDVRG